MATGLDGHAHRHDGALGDQVEAGLLGIGVVEIKIVGRHGDYSLDSVVFWVVPLLRAWALGLARALGDQRAEMRRLQQVEATAAVFGREAVGIDGVGDEGAVGAAVLGLDLGQRHDLIDDAGQLQTGLAAFDLRHEHLAVVVIEAFVEDGDEHHVLAARVLQVGQGADHFLAEQAVGTAHDRACRCGR
jgi:hypothetical protein